MALKFCHGRVKANLDAKPPIVRSSLDVAFYICISVQILCALAMLALAVIQIIGVNMGVGK